MAQEQVLTGAHASVGRRRGGTAADRAWALGPYPALLVLWGGLFTGLRWNVNPDGVVYALIAERFAAGDLAGAATTYWSPLLPALAALLTALGVPALLAIRLVLLAAALACLPLVRDLSLHAGAGRRTADVAVWAAVPLVAHASLFGVYPELLLAALLLAHCRWVLVVHSTRGAVVAGGLGGLAFLAKAVGLPFVLGFATLVLLARLVAPAGPRRRAVRLAVVAAGVAALVAGPWIGVVSARAGHLTLSTAGSFNARFAAPGSWGNPMTYDGLRAPDERAASTPWEDPTALPVLRNAPEAGGAPAPVTVTDRAVNTVRQGVVGVGALVRRWWAVLPLAAVGLVLAVRGAVGDRSRGRLPWRRSGVTVGTVAAAVLFSAGMSLLVVIERYLWFPMLALLPAAAVGLAALTGRRPRLLAVVGAVVVLAVGLTLAPVALAPWDEDRPAWRLADRLADDAPLTGPLAGAQDWRKTQLVAYLSGVPYVGTTGTGADGAQTLADLRRVGAEQLVVWGEAPAGLPAASRQRPVVYDVTPGGLVPHRP